MKFSKQDLLTMLIGLFLFSSCKDANTIGLGLEDSSKVVGDLYENTLITSKTQLDDAVGTNTLIRYPLGQINDGIFGTAIANTAMTVGIPSDNFKFGTVLGIDSAVLILPYSTQFYGDSTQTYDLQVKQLVRNISLDRSFLSSIEWGKDATEVLATRSTTLKPTTSFKVTDIVAGKADTLISVIPQLRIKLDAAKINTKILSLDSASLSKNNKFINKFNGLFVTATTAGTGGMMFLDLAGANAKLQIYYRKEGTTTGTIDTTTVSFPIKSAPSAPVAAYIKHTYTNTDITAQLADATTKQYDQTYLQALSGLRNKLTFNFDDLKTKLAGTKIAINRAELVVDVSPNGTDAHFKPAERLSLYRYDIAGQRKNIPDNDLRVPNVYNGDPRAVSAAEFGGFFDSVNGRYIFTVTAYIQDLLDDKTKDYGTFLAPTSLTEFNVTPYATSASRTILLKPQTNVANTTKRMKLNIYYTKLK